MLRKNGKQISMVVRILFSLLVALVVFTVGLYAKDSTIIAYTGSFPCPNCDDMKITLTLFGTGDYTLKSLYINRGSPFTEKGTWEQEYKNTMQEYVLKSDNNSISYYEIVDDKTIAMLDMHGNPMKKGFTITLKKQ